MNDSSFYTASERHVQYHFRVCVNFLKCLISVISVSRHVIAVFSLIFLPPGVTLECVACICSEQKLVIASDEAVYTVASLPSCIRAPPEHVTHHLRCVPLSAGNHK